MKLFVREKAFYKKVWELSAPISAQQVITVGVNMMDTIMLGQLNETALAASAVGTQVHNFYHFMSMGMGMGASVLIARYWGAGDKESLSKTLTLLYRFCFTIALAVTLIVGMAPAAALNLLTKEPEAIAEGVRYLRWTLPCFFLYGSSTVTTLVLRNSGQTHIPLYTAIGAFFINIFFNWMFIFGKLGAPAMGVAGAAVGTLISRIFEFSMICGYFFLIDQKIRFRLRNLFQSCKGLVSEYLRISLPVMISDTLLGVGNSMVMAVWGHMGTACMSANSITNVTQQIASVFSAGLGQSALIITGNTLGEGDTKKAAEQGISFTFIGFLIGIFCGVLILAISPWVIGMYRITSETAAIATQLMCAVSITVIFMMTGSILTKGILRSGGDTRFLMIADILFLWVFSVPLGAMAGLVWKWPPFWVFFFLRIDNLIKTVICLFRMRSGKWIKKIRGVSH